MKNNELLNEFKNGHKNRILSIDISNDSTLLVSGGRDSLIVVWNFTENEVITTLKYSKGIVTCVQIFTEHSDVITSVEFSPDGSLLATSGGDGMVNIYDVKGKKLITSLSDHGDWVREVSFSKDSTRLILY